MTKTLRLIEAKTSGYILKKSAQTAHTSSANALYVLQKVTSIFNIARSAIANNVQKRLTHTRPYDSNVSMKRDMASGSVSSRNRPERTEIARK
ncbi:hypothetical protein BaRGS_00026695 [Batillaria attramentaria]|uniref:Uncharacterized protein n=1 Tax=Batillaria attramentaria TaxID=370345 RepID=A0ABD0K5B2_9CAEN